MRRAALLLLPIGLLVLSGCTVQQPYTPLDLIQVRAAARAIVPIYVNFMNAYLTNDRAALVRDYRREQVACRLEDRVDRRDTIDPNVNLFAASADLGGFCNNLESAYVRWAITNHLPYDSTVNPSGADPFNGSAIALAKMPVLLAHPSERS